MPIKLSEIFNRIDQITRRDGLYNYFCNLFDNTEYVRSTDFSALAPFVDAVRNNPKSVVAMNDFAYTLARMTRADYDYFMNQPENKDIVELYNKTDRGSEEYRNKLVDETIERGKALIDGFEKETGVSFERETQKYNQLKKAYSKLKDDGWELYSNKYFLTNHDWQVREKRSRELRKKILEEARGKFEAIKTTFYAKHIQPQKDKLQKDITRFREYLIDKSSITDEQANAWVKENIKFSEEFLLVLSKNNQTKEAYEKIIKEIYKITNGKLNLSTALRINVEDKKNKSWLAWACPEDSCIVVQKNKQLKQSTFAHELGHFVEYNETKSLPTVHQYLKRRSNNNIGNLIFYNSYGYKDEFNDEYTGAMNWDGYTECISTGFEQLFFGEYGEARTEFDAEHMALLLGVIQAQTTKSLISSHRTKANQNAVVAKAWKAAVKEAIPEKIYDEMLERDYTSRRPQWISLMPTEDNELWVDCKIKGLRKIYAVPFKSLEEIPLTMYLVWGYYFNKFPVREPEKSLLELLMQFRHSDSGGETIVPFWYTIGMKLPAMV